MFILSRTRKRQQEVSRIVQNQTQPRKHPLSAREWFDLQELANNHLTSLRSPMYAAAGLLAWRIVPANDHERVLVQRLEAAEILIKHKDVWRLTEFGLRQVLGIIRHLTPSAE